MLEIGINALHPIEPKAMDIFELKRTIGDSICLMGNLEMDRLLTRSPSEYYDIQNRNTGRLTRIAEKRPLADFPTSESSEFSRFSIGFPLVGRTPREVNG